MILMYHKVAPDTPTMWWVSVDNFYRQMCELQAYDVVYLDAYDPNNPRHVVITFDGIYDNILLYALPILQKFGYPYELFFTSDHMGKGNEFDDVEPAARFLGAKELQALVASGGRLQWHTRSHPHMAQISDSKALIRELTPPTKVRRLDPNGFTWFAYPYGEFTDEVLSETRTRFAGALTCNQGNDTDRYQLNRITVENQTSFAKGTIGVIVPCYNYGPFLVEALESLLHQTRPPQAILIADDASTDNTKEIGLAYQHRYPDLIRYTRNEKNLGIIGNFQKALKTIETDYVCFLGADNRFRSDYLEKTSALLDTDPKVAIAYTDFSLFGPLAATTFSLMPPKQRGPVLENTHYIVKFPNFSQKVVETLQELNFMHGSSLFRRSVARKVGGYRKAPSKQAEDHHLFHRIIQAGSTAKRVPEPVLEYRQHSFSQANTQLNSYYELLFYREQYHASQAELQRIQASKFWKLLYCYKDPKRAFRQYLPKVLAKIKQKMLR